MIYKLSSDALKALEGRGETVQDMNNLCSTLSQKIIVYMRKLCEHILPPHSGGNCKKHICQKPNKSEKNSHKI